MKKLIQEFCKWPRCMSPKWRRGELWCKCLHQWQLLKTLTKIINGKRPMKRLRSKLTRLISIKLCEPLTDPVSLLVGCQHCPICCTQLDASEGLFGGKFTNGLVQFEVIFGLVCLVSCSVHLLESSFTCSRRGDSHLCAGQSSVQNMVPCLKPCVKSMSPKLT